LIFPILIIVTAPDLCDELILRLKNQTLREHHSNIQEETTKIPCVEHIFGEKNNNDSKKRVV
jgi:hypothetical protein